MPDNIQLSVVLSAVDKLTAPLKTMKRSLRGTEKGIQADRDALRALKKAQGDVARFDKLNQQLATSKERLHAAQTSVRGLTVQMKQSEKPTKAMARALGKAKQQANQLQTATQQQRLRLGQLNQRLTQSGMDTRRLSQTKAQLTAQEKQLTGAFERERQAQERLARTQAKRARMMQNAKKMGLMGGAALGIGYALKRKLASPLTEVMGLEQAKGELASVGIKNMGVVVQKAHAMAGQLAGVTSASFVKAAYDIRSGISALNDEGVAQLTAQAALTAKATKANVATMTSVFATGYGVFKEQFKQLSDADFGARFSASLAKSVQQFKTTGEAMQQAIQSMGAGATKVGMSLSEQMTTLGMLQGQMQASEAGTALRAFTQNAAKADDAFHKLSETTNNKVRVRILDAQGMIRSMVDVLTDLKARYGDTLSARDAAEIQQAFGTVQAAKIINALYGQANAFKANRDAIDEAGKAGLAFTQNMAKLADDNFASRTQLVTQRLNLLKEQIGYALVPALETLMKKLTPIISTVSTWVNQHKGLTATLSAITLGLGAIAVVAAPVFLGIAAITSAMGLLSGAIPAVILGIRGISTVLLLNPIGLTITAIATGAFLIIRYWTPIATFFKNLWNKILSTLKSAATAMVNFITAPMKTIRKTLGTLWDRMTGHTTVTLNTKAQQKVESLTAKSKPMLQRTQTPKPINTNNKPVKLNVNQPQTTTINMPVTIHAAESMNERQLADTIKEQLQNLTQEKRRAPKGFLFDPIAM